jgi:hypothetical protein
VGDSNAGTPTNDVAAANLNEVPTNSCEGLFSYLADKIISYQYEISAQEQLDYS